MNFEEHMRKVQEISHFIENKNYAEDVLNSKDIDISKDFEYVCLAHSANYDLVLEIIARLAQNGNRALVENNIKSISINIWKDLINKNEIAEEICINNFKDILENAGIITFREIEKFLENAKAKNSVYENMPTIIKKLGTYDRASLISCVKNQDGGIDVLKNNLELFFVKGEYDISTTYSKIVKALDDIEEISKIEILEACNVHLSEMLMRETAIDDETNDLLEWLNDTFEYTNMDKELRAKFKNKIDEAILNNFEDILDRSDYNKNTIKILRQFDCTKEKFNEDEPLVFENSSKLIHTTKIYDLNFNKEENKEDVDEKEIVEQNKINLDEEREEEKQELEEIADIVSKIAQQRQQQLTQEDIIKDLVDTKITETDKIIEKIIEKQNLVEQSTSDIQEEEIIVEDESAETDNFVANENDNTDTEINENVELDNKEVTSLAIIEEPKEIFIKRLWSKIKNIFKLKSRYEKIGE